MADDRMKHDEDKDFGKQAPGRSGQGAPGGQQGQQGQKRNVEDDDEFATGGENRGGQNR